MNKDICTVKMDDEVKQSNDFVAILAHENGDASLYYCTDALTLGMAMKMVAKAFITEMNKLSEEERSQIEAILGDAFIKEKVESDLHDADKQIAERLTQDE
ncbi:MAG: hypothetical protein WC102_10735 [Saccharofermentanales bacterium]